MAGHSSLPTFHEEGLLQAQGYSRIAGIDEAGRGPLAGPVVAAAVVLPPGLEAPWLRQVRDSKQLAAPVRERLFQEIAGAALGIGVGVSDHRVIDEKGILAATRLAMMAAIKQLSPRPECLLIDHLLLPDVKLPQRPIVGGDGLSLSIACASIIAKVTRDRMMSEYDGTYPGYGFRHNKGYGTPEHLACLHRLGPCPIHRRSFQPVRALVET